ATTRKNTLEKWRQSPNHSTVHEHARQDPDTMHRRSSTRKVGRTPATSQMSTAASSLTSGKTTKKERELQSAANGKQAFLTQHIPLVRLRTMLWSTVKRTMNDSHSTICHVRLNPRLIHNAHSQRVVR